MSTLVALTLAKLLALGTPVAIVTDAGLPGYAVGTHAFVRGATLHADFQLYGRDSYTRASWAYCEQLTDGVACTGVSL